VVVVAIMALQREAEEIVEDTILMTRKMIMETKKRYSQFVAQQEGVEERRWKLLLQFRREESLIACSLYKMMKRRTTTTLRQCRRKSHRGRLS